MLKAITVLAVCLTVGVGVASGSVSHALGNGGKVYQFDSVCHRVTFVPPGVSTKEGVNIIAQQARCLARREARIRNCFRRVDIPDAPAGRFDHGDGKPGDWTNVDQLYSTLIELRDCGTR